MQDGRAQVSFNQGDIILVSLRDFRDEEADVVRKYTADEARSLQASGELPESAKINDPEASGTGEEDNEFEFGDVRGVTHHSTRKSAALTRMRSQDDVDVDRI